MTIAHSAPLPVPATLETLTISLSHRQPAGGNAIKTTVLEEQALAKSNPDLDPEVREMVDIVMALPPRHVSMKSALKEYLLSDKPLNEIASKHSYTAAALVYWVRKLGLPQRPRGRPLLLEATEDHKRVIMLVREHGIAGAARRERVSKQWVSQVISRWAPELKGKRKLQIVVPLRQPKQRRSTRQKIVSFRLSAAEWQRLLATQLNADGKFFSGSAKARAIVLNYIGSSGGDGGKAAQAAPAPEPAPAQADIVNVYNQKAA